MSMTRGDKNKNASRESSNQNNQSVRDEHLNSDQSKSKTRPLESQGRKADPNTPRKLGTPLEEIKRPQGGERRFNLLVDSVPYMVKAIPFRFNGEMRYRVSFNGSPEHVFTWDSSLGQLRAINDDSSTMPDNLELAISEKLQSKT
jgi:hypothetical protein